MKKENYTLIIDLKDNKRQTLDFRAPGGAVILRAEVENVEYSFNTNSSSSKQFFMICRILSIIEQTSVPIAQCIKSDDDSISNDVPIIVTIQDMLGMLISLRVVGKELSNKFSFKSNTQRLVFDAYQYCPSTE